MASAKTEQVTTDHGGQFDAYMFMPEDANGSAILLLQSIWGVGEYVKAVAERLNALGYIVMTPDMYWRIERGVSLPHSPEGLEAADSYLQRFEWDKGLQDCGTALDHLRAMAEVTGKVGVMGFSFGGDLAYLTAAAFDPDAAVSYYGRRVPDSLERAGEVKCPLLLHFGGRDGYVERDAIAKVEKLAARRKYFEIHVHENAGHEFDDHLAEMFHDPDAASGAWKITTDFLKRNL